MRALTLVRSRRALVATVALGAAIAGVAACEPADGSPNPDTVSLTTRQTATEELEKAGVQVARMSCTAKVAEASPTGPGARKAAAVRCEGETKDNKDIRVVGTVTREQYRRCVRGHLTATVGERTVFRRNELGDCTNTPRPSPPTPRPTDRTPVGEEPRPTVTVTVTETVGSGSSKCRCDNAGGSQSK